MPTYDYKCEKCGKHFEIFHSISEKKKDCPDPKCDGKLQRLMSKGSGFILKGSGFYETDYKNKT